MGTVIVSIILISIISMVIVSIIKAKRAGRHPSCGGNCGSCGHACSEYPHVEQFLANQKSSKAVQNYTCRK